MLRGSATRLTVEIVNTEVFYNVRDTGYAIPWRNGEFKVRGLQEGTYTGFVNASNGYRDTTITGVKISRGRETDLPRIALHK